MTSESAKYSLLNLHRIANSYWENYRISGGDNHGTLKRFLNEDKLKIAWLMDQYGAEFDELMNLYKESEAYQDKLRKLNKC